jgi:hypothetical protein
MAGSIADFKASFKTDLARSNKFDVYIPVPLGLSPFIGISRQLTLRCETSQLPGRNLDTTTRRIYGVDEPFPNGTSSFDNITMTFLVGDDMKEKAFFDSWLNWIQPTITYDVKYKADYAVSLRINQYNVQNKLSLSIDLMDAYPISVNQLDLDWASDSVHKLAVTFAYTSWRSNDINSIATEYLEYKVANGQITTNSNLGNDIVNDNVIKNAFNPDVNYR